MAKGTPKVIVSAERRPPHPWGETGESGLEGLTVLETAKTANQLNRNGPKKH